MSWISVKQNFLKYRCWASNLSSLFFFYNDIKIIVRRITETINSDWNNMNINVSLAEIHMVGLRFHNGAPVSMFIGCDSSSSSIFWVGLLTPLSVDAIRSTVSFSKETSFTDSSSVTKFFFMEANKNYGRHCVFVNTVAHFSLLILEISLETAEYFVVYWIFHVRI